MTKKDRSSSQSPAQSKDFFSDISQDLQMEVGSLSDSTQQETGPTDTSSQEENQLFSQPEQQTFSTSDEARLFDASSGTAPPPPTDTSVTDAVPYPAALSDIALEVDTAQVSSQSSTSHGNDGNHDEANDSKSNETLESEDIHTSISVEDAESGENIVASEKNIPEEEQTTQEVPQTEDAEDTEVVAATSDDSNEAEAKGPTEEDPKPESEASVEAEETSTTETDEFSEVAEKTAISENTEAETEPEDPEDESSAVTSASEHTEEASASEEIAETAEAAGAEDVDTTVEAEEVSASKDVESTEAVEGTSESEDVETSDENPVAVELTDEVTSEEPSSAPQEPHASEETSDALPANDLEFIESKAGQSIAGYTLVEVTERDSDRIVWSAQAEDEEEANYIIRELSPERYCAGLQSFPELPELNLHRPIQVIEQEARVFLIYKKLNGYLLTEQIRALDHHWTIGQLRLFIRRLAQDLHKIHKAGYIFLQLNEYHIWVDEDRNPVLWDIERLYDDRTPYHVRPIYEGFSAPEMFNHPMPVGTHTDIFALGSLLHYMISQCPLFNHLDLPDPKLPSPRLYQLDFPVGLDHVIEYATHVDLDRRYAHIPEFLNAFERALQEIEERHRQPHTPLQLSIGHDIHIGINKGLRNPINQDALFWRYDRLRNKGLFLVADGVSHCHYGSGDRASSILIQAARQCWDTLLESPLMDAPTDYRQRRQIINSIFQAANQAIANEVNELYDRVEGYVEDVMGSTCVGGFLDGNQITITNLGDSRAYLRTDHYIEQINVDHDYKTAQLQVGQDMRAIQNLMGGSLITRCVGSCRKDEQLKVEPLQLQADFFELTLVPGDTIILCSDGLTDYAGETEEEARDMISKIVEVHTEPISACFWLTALANQRGGGDNISVIEIKVLDYL